MPFQPTPVADFSEDTWWIWVIKAVAIIVFLSFARRYGG